jgi:hypothetical protein
VPQELLVKAFRHLDQGGTVASLVTELGMITDEAKLAGKEYYALQAIQPRSSPKAEAKASPKEEQLRDLKVDVEIAELESKKEELERPVEEAKQLAALRPILDERGIERQLSCEFFNKDHCNFNRWRDRPDSIHAEGELFQKGKWWHIRPKPVSCAVCNHYHDKSTPTPSQLQTRISQVEADRAYLRTLNMILDHTGMRKKESCRHHMDNLCTYWSWTDRPAVPYQMGEPRSKDGKWYISPTFPRCAVCQTYLERGESPVEKLASRASILELKFKALPKIVGQAIKPLVVDPYGIRDFKCSECGAQTHVAIQIFCTNCKHEAGWKVG